MRNVPILNCDQIFEQLKAWAVKQPKSIVGIQPTPTPEDTMAEDVIDGYFVLKGLDFPQQSFVQGGHPYGYAKTDDDAYFWVSVDEAFEALTTPWYQSGLCKKDASLVEAMAEQASGEASHIMYSSPLLSQQFRVIRQQTSRLIYGDPESWEASKPFIALVRITSCRTMVPVRSEEAQFGWKTETIALYRKGEGLSILEPGCNVVHFFGVEPAAIPTFLSSGL